MNSLATYPDWVIPNHLEVCARSGSRPGWHAEERPVKPGTDLCGPCHARFPRILGDLSGYWPDLTAAVVKLPARNYSKDRVKGGSSADVGALWNPAAQVTATELEEWTRYLMRTVLRERRFYDNEPLGFTDDRIPTRLALAQLALHHARWLTHYPTIGPSLVDDAIRLRSRAMAALDQPAQRRVNMTGMYCQQIIAETDYTTEICGAQMAGIIPIGDDSDQTGIPAVIVCGANPTHPTSRLERKDWILAHQ